VELLQLNHKINGNFNIYIQEMTRVALKQGRGREKMLLVE
jgi:hypothetical protein